MNKDTNYELIKFEDGDFKLDVNVSPKEETVWLTQAQMAELYNLNIPAINKHINNIINDNELTNSTISKMEIIQLEGTKKVKRLINIYNLDMIISVGYRVNSKRSILFRRWANSILKQYLLKGYPIKDRGKKISHIFKLEIIDINELLNNEV